jgi:hypothetical protein
MLWFDKQAEEAANFYVAIFKNSKIKQITHYAGEEFPEKKSQVMTVSFECIVRRAAGSSTWGKGSLLLCCPQTNAWQSRKDIVNLTADVVRIKASAEQFEDQGPACLRALLRALPPISSTLSLVRSLSHSENAG